MDSRVATRKALRIDRLRNAPEILGPMPAVKRVEVRDLQQALLPEYPGVRIDMFDRGGTSTGDAAMAERQGLHPGGPIRRLAIVSIVGGEPKDLIGSDPIEGEYLITKPLEQHGKVLIFMVNKKTSKILYDVVAYDDETVGWDIEDGWIAIPMTDRPLTIISSLGSGQNIGRRRRKVRTVVIDCLDYRPKSLWPGGRMPKSRKPAPRPLDMDRQGINWARIDQMARVTEHALCGGPDTVSVLLLLNADAELPEILAETRSIRCGAVEPPLLITCTSVPEAIEGARRWFERGGGDWPGTPSDPSDPSWVEAGRGGWPLEAAGAR